jgi:hypothetical protein
MFFLVGNTALPVPRKGVMLVTQSTEKRIVRQRQA